MFTARNRQNPFAKRRRAQAEAEAAPAPESSPEPPAPKPVQMATAYDSNKSPEHTETPDIATLATGGVVAHPILVERVEEFPPSEEQTAQANVVLDVPPISAETQAKIDEIVNRAVPPVELPAEVDEASPNAPLPDAENFEREAPGVKPEPTSEEETAAILADPDTMAAIAEAEAEPVAEPKRGRGRPRPQATIDRDNAVHALLAGADAETGISKESLAAELGEKEQQVYSSLRQLSKEGRAETRYVKPHGYRWFAV